MTLLFDENLSPRLVRLLADLYPGSAHVHDLGLGAAKDDDTWEYGGGHGLTIVPKDVDYYHRSLRLGHPPKIIWVRMGNCSTHDVAHRLRERYAEIVAFGDDEATAAFILL